MTRRQLAETIGEGIRNRFKFRRMLLSAADYQDLLGWGRAEHGILRDELLALMKPVNLFGVESVCQRRRKESIIEFELDEEPNERRRIIEFCRQSRLIPHRIVLHRNDFSLQFNFSKVPKLSTANQEVYDTFRGDFEGIPVKVLKNKRKYSTLEVKYRSLDND